MAIADATTLLDHVNNLPAMPKAIRDLMQEFGKPEVDVDRVCRLVGADPVLSVKMLRLANSVFYHRAGTVTRLQDAVVFVGTQATRNLVMSVGLAGSIRFPAQFPAQSFWRYSLHAAVASRHVAGQARQDADTAFAIGLMRAIGQPLAASVIASELSAIDRICPFYDESRTGAERDRLGFSYVDVSAALAQRWHFPEAMVTALRESQGAGQPKPTASTRMADAVALGAWMAGEHEWKRGMTRDVPAVVEGRLRRLNLSGDMLEETPPLAQLSQGLEALVN